MRCAVRTFLCKLSDRSLESCCMLLANFNAKRPRSARARDFVNFRKKFMHRARAARPRGFDSLPSQDPD